jgi:hypothetical protein
MALDSPAASDFPGPGKEGRIAFPPPESASSPALLRACTRIFPTTNQGFQRANTSNSRERKRAFTTSNQDFQSANTYISKERKPGFLTGVTHRAQLLSSFW